MKTSTSRILTTHVGSLPRSEPLLSLLLAKERGLPVDPAQFSTQVSLDAAAVLRQQQAVGIDIAGDGELPRIGFSYYVKDRMTGFGGVSKRGTVTDFARFPGYAKLKAGLRQGEDVENASFHTTPECQCAVHYDPTQREARLELDLFAAALDQPGLRGAFTETFMTAASPGIVSTTLLRSNTHPAYLTDRDYVLALAEELRSEYELIVSRGHVLQIDAPDLAIERQVMFAGKPLDAFLARAAMHVEALNAALANIPRERVRMHVCWGNWDGPHIDDVDLEPLLPLLYTANVGAISLACAMPRHQHEYKLFKRYPLPSHLSLIPGVIDVTTNVLEHPEVVADRIERICNVIGDPKRVIAGTDCGFGTFAGYALVAPDVVWEKLRMLKQGADLASTRLFS